MIYFEFNRTGGKEKYIPMTETAYQQAKAHDNRWFLIFEEDGYVLECTQAEHADYYSKLNHEKNSRRGKDGKYPELLSIERNEVECSDSMSVFTDGDNSTVADIVLDRLETAEKIALLHKALEQLTPDEQHIIQEVFHNGRTRSSLAKEFGVVRETMNEKYHKILYKLRDYMTGK